MRIYLAYLFSEKSVRQGFIRKVYSILFCQLLVTIGVICLFMFNGTVNRFTKTGRYGQYGFWAALIATIVVMIVIAYCNNVRRSFPLNVIMLGLFTICESYLLGAVSAHYEVEAVLMAIGIVAVVTLCITLFVFQTKYVFTMCSGFLFVALIVLICFGFLTILFHSIIIRLVFASVGALIFCIWLMVDTQLMMGGKKRYEISPEEYIFAALNLYVDIVTLFLYILKIYELAKEKINEFIEIFDD